MNIYKFLLNYIFIVLFDYIWFYFLSKDFYTKNVGFLLKKNFNFGAIIIFYLIYVFAYNHFVLKNFSKLKNFILESFIFSLCMYSTFDLINYAVIYRWSLSIAIVDMIWGIFATTLSGYLTMRIYKKIFVK